MTVSAVVRFFVWFVVVLPAGVLLVALAVANRHNVSVVLDPFSPANPVLAYEMPLFILVFGSLMAGLLMGGMATWLGQARWRHTARRRSEEARHLRSETAQLSRQLEAATQPRLPQAASAD